MVFFESIVLIFLLIVGQALLRRYITIAWLTLFIFIYLSFLTVYHVIPYWNAALIFGAAKIIFLAIGIFWLLLCKSYHYYNNKIFFTICWLILSANILCAVILDLSKFQLNHFFNSLTGVLLICSLPGPKAINIRTTHKITDLLWDIDYSWIVCYCLWNWTFIYINSPEFSARHIAILGASFIVALIERQRWVQARAFTLLIYLVLELRFDYQGKLFNSSYWYNVTATQIIPLLTLMLMVIYLMTKYSKLSNSYDRR